MKLVPLLFLALPALCLAEPIRDHSVEAELVPETNAFVPGETTTVALRIKHDPGWHTYWKNPGLAGVPVSIKWDLPEGFTAGPIQWAPPQRVIMASITTYGYEGEVYLLTDITAPSNAKPGSKAKLTANITWMMCAKTCIPSNPTLTLAVPVASKTESNPRAHAAIEKTRKSFPRKSDAWTAEATRSDNGSLVLLTVTPGENAKPAPDDAYFYADDGLIDSDTAQEVTVDEKGRLHMTLTISEFGPEKPTRFSGILQSKKGWQKDGDLTDMVIDIPLPPGK
jgi:DsbC/DsbD-like thiol-disulfide interchange protein